MTAWPVCDGPECDADAAAHVQVLDRGTGPEGMPDTIVVCPDHLALVLLSLATWHATRDVTRWV
jgi:hypothetical protein